jgi:hypothetical protein
MATPLAFMETTMAVASNHLVPNPADRLGWVVTTVEIVEANRKAKS